MMNAEIDIYSYNDYRALLKDYYDRQKAKFPKRVSYRYLAQKAGFSSSNFLHLVISNQRNLSMESTRRVGKMMKLNERERNFFEHLVLFTQAAEAEGKDHALKRMLAFREYRDARKLTPSQFNYFSKWYFPVIRELVNLPEFREDPAWIAQTIQPTISAAEAETALAGLIAIGFLVRDKHGCLQQSEQNLATDSEIVSTALMSFHRTMIDHAKRSLLRPPSDREISSLTLSLSQREFDAVRARIRAFQNDIQSLLQSSSSDDPAHIVCQLNFQLFNLTHSQRNRI